MSWNVVELGDVRPTPWHNGGGMTRELLAWPRSSDWTVRVSVAEVTRDGPFSQLPGVRRWFAVLSGGGVRLRLDSATHELDARATPFEFDGGARIGCELLAGPTRDLNLMLKAGKSHVQRVSGAWAKSCRASTLVAVYANEFPVTVGWRGEVSALAPASLAWRILDCNGQVQLDGQQAFWMEIEP